MAGRTREGSRGVGVKIGDGDAGGVGERQVRGEGLDATKNARGAVVVDWTATAVVTAPRAACRVIAALWLVLART